MMTGCNVGGEKRWGSCTVLLKTRLLFSHGGAVQRPLQIFNNVTTSVLLWLASTLSLLSAWVFLFVCLSVSSYCAIAKPASDVTSSGPLMMAIAGAEEAELRRVAVGNCEGLRRLPGTFLLYMTSSASVLITAHFTLLFFAFNPRPLSKLLLLLLLWRRPGETQTSRQVQRLRN